jgi:hypothetical protein
MTPDVMDSYEQVLPSADFIRREAMVPMRDGVKLYTAIVMKKGTANAPILLSRSPYDAHHSTHRGLGSLHVVGIARTRCAAATAEFRLIFARIQAAHPIGTITYRHTSTSCRCRRARANGEDSYSPRARFAPHDACALSPMCAGA